MSGECPICGHAGCVGDPCPHAGETACSGFGKGEDMTDSTAGHCSAGEGHRHETDASRSAGANDEYQAGYDAGYEEARRIVERLHASQGMAPSAWWDGFMDGVAEQC